MTDPHRRLRLVTEAAYVSRGATAARACGGMPVQPSEDDVSGGGGTGGPAAAKPDVDELVLGGPSARQDFGFVTGTEPQTAMPGNRWGTPVLLAVRLGVVVIVLALAATVTIVLTRPSAPAHQPELAWPDPPPDWTSAASGPGSSPGSSDPVTADEPGPVPEPGESAATGASALVVHVAGSVHEPGIVELSAAARVHEAISAAGGPTAEADLAALNLAAPVQDGQQVYVPAIGEEPRAVGMGAGGAQDATGGQSVASDGTTVIDLNSATSTDLQTLPGIGPAIAERILAHRDEHGPYGRVEDLLAVSGIGPATLERLRDRVRV